MIPTVMTRWEELRPVFGGPKKHRQHVEAWLATHEDRKGANGKPTRSRACG